MHVVADELLERPDDGGDVAPGRDAQVDRDRRLVRARPQRLDLLRSRAPRRHRAGPGPPLERGRKAGSLAIDLAGGPRQQDDQRLVEAALAHVPPVRGLGAVDEEQRGLHLVLDAPADQSKGQDDDRPAHKHEDGVAYGEASQRGDQPISTLTRVRGSRHRVTIGEEGFACFEPLA